MTDLYGIKDILGEYPSEGIFDNIKLESYIGYMLYKLGYHVWGPHAHKKKHKKEKGYGDFIGKGIYV